MNARTRSFLVRASALGAVVAGSFIFAAHATSASAAVARFHLALTKAEPKANDTVATSPTAIKLYFTESVKASATTVRVTGADAKIVAIGPVTVDTAAKAPAVVAVKQALAPGKYTVAWKVIGADGHPAEGTFAFTFRAKSQ
jgi:methionine-rich copper-binding protein CopC